MEMVSSEKISIDRRPLWVVVLDRMKRGILLMFVFALFLTFCTYTEAEYAAKYWVKKEDTMHSVGHAFLPDDSRMIFHRIRITHLRI